MKKISLYDKSMLAKVPTESWKIWKKFGYFPAWNSLESTFLWSVSMEKGKKFL